MKKIFLWILTAILTCCLGMTLTSCSDNDDNKNTETPVVDDDNYTIVVGEGMTMNENEFEMVKAIDGDPAVVNALKTIDGVMDVKPFKMIERYDYYAKKVITKTAYFFNFKQSVDHNDASKGWFKQQCVLTLAGDKGNNRPTVLHTEGYALEKEHNRLFYIIDPMLVSVLNANCLHVEYRYHGWSLPEGWTNNFHYLRAKQQSDDLHAIVTAIKQSGLINASSKWVSTGVSKDGEATAHYAYHYPNEMDAYVPFCAPFLLSLFEKGTYSYILSKEAFDNDIEEMEKVKAAFRAYVGNKTLQAQCVAIAKQNRTDIADLSDEEVRLELLGNLYGFYFSKMQYVPYSKWEYMVPKAGDSAETFYAFIMANERTKYDSEKEEEYKRRKETVDDLEPVSGNANTPRASRRAAAVQRFNPYFVQACIEDGHYVCVTDWVDDLLTPEERETITSSSHIPSKYGVTYDNGQFVRDLLKGMKQSDCHMMFIYSMQDPWTGNQIPDEYLGRNSQKLFIRNGTHDDYIDKWNASERNQLFQWLKGLGFDL